MSLDPSDVPNPNLVTGPRALWARWSTRLRLLGGAASDSDDLRLNKSLLVLVALMVLPAGIVWGLVYIAYGEPAAGAIPLLYSALSGLSIVIFARTRRFTLFRASELMLILLLPFVLMFALGGFINASAVIMWSIIAPLGALVFDEPRQAGYWFLAYLGLIVLSTFLQAVAPASNHLPHNLVVLLFALNIGAVSSVSFVLLHTFVRQRQAYLNLLRVEQHKSENLLLNILPAEIAAILKNEDRTIADYYPGASILFADMVGFTPLSAAMTPAAMVELLNDVFTHFDQLVDKYNLEKIRTIGDSYMVASGVPRPRSDHAQVLARLALDMLSYIQANGACQRLNISFRVGLNSGPVVAGVIGRKKFIYDLWGDAVNTASRMESHGTPGQIQITAATYALIESEFVCEPRGRIQVKGKGEMETWYLRAARG